VTAVTTPSLGQQSKGRRTRSGDIWRTFLLLQASVIFEVIGPLERGIMSKIEDESLIEELANGITHGIGLALSIVGLIALVVLSVMRGNAWHIAGCTTFGVTLVLLYAASTLYHSFHTPRLKRILKILDHTAIYLLIAGTYTPFTLVNLRGFWGWTLFSLVWGLSVFGILWKLFHVDRFQLVSTLVYIAMGWLVLIAIKPVMSAVPLSGIVWLVAGGLFYTVGVLFYALKRVPYNHAIWHVFVMAGSICHYFAVMFYVLPRSS
jgi:hemolysin III